MSARARRVLALALLSGTVALSAACGPAPPGPAAAPPDDGAAGDTRPVSGALTLALPGGAPREFAAERCLSGEREAFFGVDLVAPDGATFVRLVQDPLGERVVRIAAGETNWIFRRADCRALAMDVRRTRDRVNSIWGMEGELALDCSAEGASVRGEVRFARCF